jgi:uncharacterized membrane protein
MSGYAETAVRWALKALFPMTKPLDSPERQLCRVKLRKAVIECDRRLNQQRALISIVPTLMSLSPIANTAVLFARRKQSVEHGAARRTVQLDMPQHLTEITLSR